MNDELDIDELSERELTERLVESRSRIEQLESELEETNEGMIALTIELEDAKDRYQTLFERGTDAIVLIDPERKSIHDVNPAACELFEYNREEILSLKIGDLFPEESSQFGTLAGAVVSGWGGDYLGRTKHGRSITVNMSTSKVTLHGKLYLLASIRDVTMRKHREQRLEVLTRVFRHNLRNDGNVIQGHAGLVAERVDDHRLEASAAKIGSRIARLMELSEKVRRIQATVERDRASPVDIDELFGRQRARFEERTETGTLEIDRPEDSVSVGEDLGIALEEAIENATSHGGEAPTIHLKSHIDHEDRRVHIYIEDDGPGIPDQELDALRSGTETPLIHGSGIGLWSIHWVVESLGGELRVENADDAGSVIEMVVPFEFTNDRSTEEGPRP